MQVGYGKHVRDAWDRMDTYTQGGPSWDGTVLWCVGNWCLCPAKWMGWGGLPKMFHWRCVVKTVNNAGMSTKRPIAWISSILWGIASSTLLLWFIASFISSYHIQNKTMIQTPNKQQTYTGEHIRNFYGALNVQAPNYNPRKQEEKTKRPSSNIFHQKCAYALFSTTGTS